MNLTSSSRAIKQRTKSSVSAISYKVTQSVLQRQNCELREHMKGLVEVNKKTCRALSAVISINHSPRTCFLMTVWDLSLVSRFWQVCSFSSDKRKLCQRYVSASSWILAREGLMNELNGPCTWADYSLTQDWNMTGARKMPEICSFLFFFPVLSREWKSSGPWHLIYCICCMLCENIYMRQVEVSAIWPDV